MGRESTLYLSLSFSSLSETFGLAPLATQSIQLIAIPEGQKLPPHKIDSICAKLKALTSVLDSIPVSIKYKPNVKVNYKGALVIASNDLIFDADTTRGIGDKRKFILPMEQKVPLSQERNVIEDGQLVEQQNETVVLILLNLEF